MDRVNENGDKVIEIKNPMSTWSMSISEAATKSACLKLNENKEVVLNPNHEYYTQIQGQMGILKMKKCNFVLCTSKDILVHEVLFDQEFWKESRAKLVKFYENIMLPEIVFPRVKLGFEPFVYSFAH